MNLKRCHWGNSMIYIKKGNEPLSLTKYKKEPFAYFDGCNKDDIRDKLLQEQGAICAYCMRRIDKKHMKIEHWYPEDRLSEQEKLDYKNMLGVCLGHIDGQKGKEDTCDAQKANQLITVDPRERKTLNEIQYRSKSGEIYSDNPKIQEDLTQILNLNSKGHRLRENRKAKLDSVILELERKWPKNIWSKEKLKAFMEEYSKLDSEGRKKEYIGIVNWYLNKKIKRNG